MTPTAELVHELQLDRFAPLTAEQLYYLLHFLRSESIIAAAPRDLGALLRDADVTVWDRLSFVLAAQVGEALGPDRDTLVAALNELTFDTSEKYSLWTQAMPDTWYTFMNYGYFDPAWRGGIAPDFESFGPWAFAAQLYARTLPPEQVVGRRMLEVASGRGGGAAMFARRGVKVVGLDATASNVMFARRAHAHPDLEFRRGRADQLPFDAESFDAVLSVEALAYFGPVERFFGEAARVLRPGGVLAWASYGPLDDLMHQAETCAELGFIAEMHWDVTLEVQLALERFRPEALFEQAPAARRRLYTHFFDNMMRGGFGSGRYLCCRYRRAG